MSGSLWAFAAKRLLSAIPLLFGVAAVTFALIHLAPGDPVDVLLGEYPATPEFVSELRARYGLDRSGIEQFFSYIGSLLQGDLGFSLRNRAPVSELIVARLPATLLLMATAMIVAAIVGIALGVVASIRPYSLLDNVASIWSIIGYSAPVFWLGQILLVVFAAGLGLFPVQGIRSLRGADTLLGSWLDVAWHLVLPASVLAFRYMAINARMTRSSMLEVFQQDYILTARSKGLAERRVVWRHGLRNALLPVVTVVGFNFGFVLTGSVLVETVFGWPGVGRLLFESLAARDTPVMLGIFLIGASTAVVANLVTDIAYSALDPRIRQ